MRKDHIDGGNEFDWGLASGDYARYRDIYPEEFYRAIVGCGCCIDGQRVLDIGTGTGVLPRNMHRFGAKFTGADISAGQIRQARELSRGLDIDYIVSAAEDIDLPDGSFDVVTACQCFEYFDKSVLLPKLHRLLTDDGRLVVAYMAWLPAESEIAAASESLVLKYNPDWTGGGMTREAIDAPDDPTGLFRLTDEIRFGVELPFTRDGWNGRMRSCRGVGASLSPERLAEFEREHLRYLSTLPETFKIPHFAAIWAMSKI